MDETLQRILERYTNEQGTLIGLLQDIQENYGYLPEERLEEVAHELDVPLGRLFSLPKATRSAKAHRRSARPIARTARTGSTRPGRPDRVAHPAFQSSPDGSNGLGPLDGCRDAAVGRRVVTPQGARRPATGPQEAR